MADRSRNRSRTELIRRTLAVYRFGANPNRSLRDPQAIRIGRASRRGVGERPPVGWPSHITTPRRLPAMTPYSTSADVTAKCAGRSLAEQPPCRATALKPARSGWVLRRAAGDDAELQRLGDRFRFTALTLSARRPGSGHFCTILPASRTNRRAPSWSPRRSRICASVMSA